jgi:hypothetical protein
MGMGVDYQVVTSSSETARKEKCGPWALLLPVWRGDILDGSSPRQALLWENLPPLVEVVFLSR